jgi:hypothetical protein
MRRPSCFLLEGWTEVVRDEQAFSVDESSYEVSGMRKRSGSPMQSIQAIAARDSAPDGAQG